jgi:hypothetical protein
MMALTEKELKEFEDYGSLQPREVHTPIRAHYIIFYHATSVPREVRSGFLTLTDAYKYLLSHLDYRPAYIWDRIGNRMIIEVLYP